MQQYTLKFDNWLWFYQEGEKLISKILSKFSANIYFEQSFLDSCPNIPGFHFDGDEILNFQSFISRSLRFSEGKFIIRHICNKMSKATFRFNAQVGFFLIFKRSIKILKTLKTGSDDILNSVLIHRCLFLLRNSCFIKLLQTYYVHHLTLVFFFNVDNNQPKKTWHYQIWYFKEVPCKHTCKRKINKYNRNRQIHIYLSVYSFIIPLQGKYKIMDWNSQTSHGKCNEIKRNLKIQTNLWVNENEKTKT